MDAVPECVRCQRSQADHDLRDELGAAGVDDVKRRIWKALGWPCARFVLTHAEIYAGNQAAFGRRPVSRYPAPAASAGANPAVARRNADAARQALGLTRHHPEAS